MDASITAKFAECAAFLKGEVRKLSLVSILKEKKNLVRSCYRTIDRKKIVKYKALTYEVDAFLFYCC